MSQGSSRHHREGTTRFGSGDFTESNTSHSILTVNQGSVEFRVCDSGLRVQKKERRLTHPQANTRCLGNQGHCPGSESGEGLSAEPSKARPCMVPSAWWAIRETSRGCTGALGNGERKAVSQAPITKCHKLRDLSTEINCSNRSGS